MRTQTNPLVLGVQVKNGWQDKKHVLSHTCIRVVVLNMVVVWSFLFREEVHMLF